MLKDFFILRNCLCYEIGLLYDYIWNLYYNQFLFGFVVKTPLVKAQSNQCGQIADYAPETGLFRLTLWQFIMILLKWSFWICWSAICPHRFHRIFRVWSILVVELTVCMDAEWFRAACCWTVMPTDVWTKPLPTSVWKWKSMLFSSWHTIWKYFYYKCECELLCI